MTDAKIIAELFGCPCNYTETQPDWSSFRREAAKDILVAAIKADDEREVIFEDKNFPCYVRQSIKLADELIKQLKEKRKQEDK